MLRPSATISPVCKEDIIPFKWFSCLTFSEEMPSLRSQKESCACGKGPGEKGDVPTSYTLLGVDSILLYGRSKAANSDVCEFPTASGRCFNSYRSVVG